MSARTFVTLIAAVVLLAGLAGLSWMVRVPSPAGVDERLICGIGLVRSPSFDEQLQAAIREQARMGESGSGDVPMAAALGRYEVFAQMCEERTAQRRLWAWPATVLGGVVLLGALVVRDREPTSV